MRGRCTVAERELGREGEGNCHFEDWIGMEGSGRKESLTCTVVGGYDESKRGEKGLIWESMIIDQEDLTRFDMERQTADNFRCRNSKCKIT